MVGFLTYFLWLMSFPLLIFGESVIGVPIMSIFFFLLLTTRVMMIKRLWWLVYVSGWLALWYHTWWWQALALLLLLLVCSQLIRNTRWVFGGIVLLSLMGGLLFGVYFVHPVGNGGVVLIGLQLVFASMVWWWLWRRKRSILPSSTWYIH